MTALETIGIGIGWATILAVLWRYLWGAVTWFMGLVVVTEKISDNGLNCVLASFINEQRNFSIGGPRYYDDFNDYVRPLGRTSRVVYYSSTRSWRVVMWRSPGRKWAWPLLVLGYSNTNPSGGTINSQYIYLRWTFNWVEFTRAALQLENERITVKGSGLRYKIVHCVGNSGRAEELQRAQMGEGAPAPASTKASRNDPGTGAKLLHYLWEDLGAEQSRRALDALSLTPELQDLAEENRFWLEEEDWYKARGIPWRRGELYEGKPGTGKTAYARATSEELDLPVYVFDLSTMDNRELRKYWTDMRQHAPCMALIEDIDGVFRGRQNIIPDLTLTFDCLLNCINGIERADGILLVLTTNHIEHVDPALGGPDPDHEPQEGDMPSRPQRVDRVVHFQELDDAGRTKMAQRILLDHPRAIPDLVTRGRRDSAAQFVERCFRFELDHKFRAYREARAR